jgi:hypothetical protein
MVVRAGAVQIESERAMKNVGRYSWKRWCRRAGNLAFRGSCLLSLHLEGGIEVDVMEPLFAG